jgi:hypothetical protein
MLVLLLCSMETCAEDEDSVRGANSSEPLFQPDDGFSFGHSKTLERSALLWANSNRYVFKYKQDLSGPLAAPRCR